jgi:hypothetical protein
MRKKIERYDKMEEKHANICKRIVQLKSKLGEPLNEIKKIDEKLAELYMLERPLREKSVIIDRKRILSDDNALVLKEYESKINQCIRQKAKIKKI